MNNVHVPLFNSHNSFSSFILFCCGHMTDWDICVVTTANDLCKPSRFLSSFLEHTHAHTHTRTHSRMHAHSLFLSFILLPFFISQAKSRQMLSRNHLWFQLAIALAIAVIFPSLIHSDVRSSKESASRLFLLMIRRTIPYCALILSESLCYCDAVRMYRMLVSPRLPFATII